MTRTETIFLPCSSCHKELEADVLPTTDLEQLVLDRGWSYTRGGLACPECKALEEQEDLLDDFGEDLQG